MNKILNRYWWILGIFIVGFPLLPMTNLGASFDGDWYIHLWFARYFAEFLKVHHHFPWAVNSTEVVGIPTSLFYGYILNPVFGFLSLIFGAQIAARLLIFSSAYLEFILVFKLFFKLSREKFFCLVVATLVVWAIYPYTVIFTEAAIPEYFATTLMACAFCAWFLFLTEKTYVSKIKYASLCFISMALSFGTHPITAFYSTFFLGLIFLFSLFYFHQIETRKSSVNTVLAAAILVLLGLFLSPWIYSNLIFMKRLTISNDVSLVFLFQDADAWWTRFQLFPFDKRSLLKGQNVDTCYLDTQINMALLILTVGFYWLSRAEFKSNKPKNLLLFLGVLLFILTSWMSLSTLPYEFLPKQFKIVQFGWRLITYQNVSLLLILIGLLLNAPQFFSKLYTDPRKSALIAIVFTLSFLGALERITHSMGARNPVPQPGFGFHAESDSTFHSKPPRNGYAMYLTKDSPEIPSSEFEKEPLFFKIGSEKDFGRPILENFSTSKSGWYLTNVVSFDWNSFSVDGATIPPEKIKRIDNFLAIQLDKGNHTVTTEFKVPSILIQLRCFSFFSLAMAFIGFCLTLAMSWFTTRKVVL